MSHSGWARTLRCSRERDRRKTMTVGRNKALFLDRDGVINVDKGHVHRCEYFEFIPGIFELCRAAQGLGYLLVVATNQAGIARGYYSESDFNHLTDWMTTQFT